jgi:glycosyltransferase involved in cell wall biosynthesis
MAPRTVDVLAGGPPSSDPYDPASSAWALAGALAARGDDVTVLHPAGAAGDAPPAGTKALAVELPLRRPGAAVEGAEFATAAAKRVRRTAELVLRDPAGLGRLGLHRAAGAGPLLAAFVRGVELDSFDHEHGQRAPAGFRDRLDTWRDRRAVRRLEEAALREADRLFYDAAPLPSALLREYGIPENRLRATLPPVPTLPAAPSRADARASFRIPLDVPVVLAPSAFDQPEPSGIDRAREAFRRVRSFFPGARLIVVGAPSPAEPGVVVAPERDAPTLARALAAADVAVFDRRTPGFDPGVVLALRVGCCVLVGPQVHLPVAPGDAVRAVPSDDAGEFASVLAELLADPAARRAVARGGERYAAPFDPARVAEVVTSATTPGAG